ncbi:MAG: T9SS type A sorting domain-containing protein [Flavobacteriales bacterium]
MRNLLFVFAVLLSLNATAQFGTLDADFDANGILTLMEPGGGFSGAFDVVVQPDQKILVAGYLESTTHNVMVIYRLHPDGSFDNSFGTAGMTEIDVNGLPAECQSIGLLPDGKIVLAGSTSSPTYGMAFSRLNSNGTLDNTFGVNGVAHISVDPTRPNIVSDMLIQEDGKILSVGVLTDWSEYSVLLARVNTDGTLDNTFSFDGVVTTAVNDEAIGTGVVQGADGRITVSGYTKVAGNEFNSFLVRYNSDGTLDNTFGDNGKLVTNFTSEQDAFLELVMSSGGHVYACGQIDNGPVTNMLVAKFNPDGSLDNTFSFDGKVETSINGDADRSADLLIQPDGKILVVGSSDNGVNRDFAMVRYNHDGTLDNTFGSGGMVVTSTVGDAQFRVVTLQSDLKILAAGSVADLISHMTLARYASGMNVGIGEVDAYIGSTLVYPNPITNNSITVEYELKTDESVSIELYDLAGKQISTLQALTKEKVGSYQKTLSLPTLSAGNYLLKLNTAKGAVSVRLTVN